MKTKVTTCKPKPNRTHPRVFTTNDVIRISKLLPRDKETHAKLIGTLLALSGLSYSICLATKAFANFSIIQDAIIKIGGITAISAIVNFLLSVLTNKLFMKIPIVKRIAAILVIVAASWDGVINALGWLIENADDVREALLTIDDLCNNATEYAKSVSDL